MSKKKPCTIFAPHVDDEMIGCWSLIKYGLVDKVYYFHDLHHHRINEALAAAAEFGFEAVFVGYDHTEAEWDKIIREDVKGQILLLPSIKDAHPDHKSVNAYGKTIPGKKKFYSVDMNHKFEVLPEKDRINKLYALKHYYPSQSALFDSDAKYHLFESIKETESRQTIWVSFQKEGVHKYPSAPDEVSFLRFPHRHIFHFRVEIEVFHDDRDIEFIMFKRELEKLHTPGVLELDYKSCEMIASDVEQYILTKYPKRCYNINVSEDNENGAVIYSGDW